jgi:hypothetical protein
MKRNDFIKTCAAGSYALMDHFTNARGRCLKKHSARSYFRANFKSAQDPSGKRP